MSESLLTRIRAEMAVSGIDIYILPANDPHMGEYIPKHWRFIEWLTGFTGSAATVVITSDFAGLWTDSRYFIQGADQLKGSGFTLMKLKVAHTPEFIEWISKSSDMNPVIGFDGRLISLNLYRRISSDLAHLEPSFRKNIEFLSEFWSERPEMSSDTAFDHDIIYAGVARDEKMKLVRTEMVKRNIEFHLLTSPEDIMWLLNIRGRDVEFSPLLMSFALIEKRRVLLFADKGKVDTNLTVILEKCGVELLPYSETAAILGSIEKGGTLLLNPSATSIQLFETVEKRFVIVEDISIPTRIKAVKNSVEIDCIRHAMVKDGIALTKFFFWLEGRLGEERITELSAAAKLEEFRREQEGFISPSFATISAVNAHAALPHYTPSKETDIPLEKGIFLLDSGGQYLDGTTDITRTVALTRPSDKQKTDFTLALMGMIDLSRLKFPAGTRGYQIEALARQHLWMNGMNYGHGTGHGVGFCLNVHEGPQTIGSAASGDPKVFLEPGMLMSIEPAFYREGEYGFRTENLVLCIKDCETEFGVFNAFETVTLCFIDRELFDMSALTDVHRRWLNEYHKMVYEKLAPHLSEVEQVFLKGKTREI